jgi:hypothetical protein
MLVKKRQKRESFLPFFDIPLIEDAGRQPIRAERADRFEEVE